MNLRPKRRGSDRRFTLPGVLKRAQSVAGVTKFDLDPSTDLLSQCAERGIWAQENGLGQFWNGPHVFVNPPWSDIGPWVEKAWAEFRSGRAVSIVMLIPDNRHGTAWWQTDVEPFRDRPQSDGYLLSTHYLPGRPRYGSPIDPLGLKAKSPPFGSMFLHWHRSWSMVTP